MWLFCLLDPGQIRYRAIYTHPNQIPGYASVKNAGVENAAPECMLSGLCLSGVKQFVKPKSSLLH